MTVFDQLNQAYNRINHGQERLNALAAASANLIALAETELTQARADLDDIAAALGYPMPARIREAEAATTGELPQFTAQRTH